MSATHIQLAVMKEDAVCLQILIQPIAMRLVMLQELSSILERLASFPQFVLLSLSLKVILELLHNTSIHFPLMLPRLTIA